MKDLHRVPKTNSDRVALSMTLFLRFFADAFFAKRYGHRAVILETVAGVPGMVAGMWTHLTSLRKMQQDEKGWIRELLAEAENERMHLMIFVEIAQPNLFERWLILIAQFVFWHFYFVLYVFFPTTAHRMIGYFEEQAVISYTEYLDCIDSGKVENINAPKIAKDYYKLPKTARLRDVVLAVRQDELGHSRANHRMANELIDDKKANMPKARCARTHSSVGDSLES
jgi:ubiquinol oxidase